jgi:hypothetical protein
MTREQAVNPLAIGRTSRRRIAARSEAASQPAGAPTALHALPLPKWNDGEDISLTISLFGPCQVFLMKTRLIP